MAAAEQRRETAGLRLLPWKIDRAFNQDVIPNCNVVYSPHRIGIRTELDLCSLSGFL